MILRPAMFEEAPTLGAIHIHAMRTLSFLPELHSVDEAIAWMGHEVLLKDHVWVAEADGEIAGYVAFTEDWIFCELEELFLCVKFLYNSDFRRIISLLNSPLNGVCCCLVGKN